MVNHHYQKNRRLAYKKTRFSNSESGFYTWCPERDLNPHDLRHYPLKIACLPIPPPGHFLFLFRLHDHVSNARTTRFACTELRLCLRSTRALQLVVYQFHNLDIFHFSSNLLRTTTSLNARVPELTFRSDLSN